MQEFNNVFNSTYRDIILQQEVKVYYKIEILDHYEYILSEVTDLISSETSGSISVNYQQGVRRTCTFTLLDRDGSITNQIAGLQWATKKFKIYIGVSYVGEDSDIYWFSQGIFCMLNPTINRTSRQITIQGVDKYGFLGSETGYNQIAVTHRIPQNEPLVKIITDTLSLDLKNGQIIDAKQPIINPYIKNQRLPYELDKAPGSYLSELFIELGNVFAADTYYDVEGHLHYDTGTLDLFYSTQASQWDFIDVLGDYIDPELTIMSVEAINSVTVVGNNTNIEKIYQYTAENNNPASPTSIKNIGLKSYYEETASVYDDNTARDYANYVLNQKSILQQSISFSCTIIPHLDVNKIITITDDFYNFSQQRFIVQSLEIPLTANTAMTVTASNISSLPYYDTSNTYSSSDRKDSYSDKKYNGNTNTK